MAAHEIGARRKISKAEKVEGPNLEQAAELFVNSSAPVMRLRRGECLSVGARKNDITKIEGRGDEEGAAKARDIGFQE